MHTVGFPTDGHGRAALAACSGLTRAAEPGVHPPCPPRLPGWFRGLGRREGGALMAEAAVQVGVTVAGRAERARVVRAFTAGVTGPGHPCGADAALPGSGLSGSGLWHSRPEVPGETVTVRAGDGIARMEVTGRAGTRGAGAGSR